MAPKIRLATEQDADQIKNIYTPIVENTHISFEVTPPLVDEISQRIQKTLEQFPWLVCEYNNQVLGYAYASPHSGRTAYQWSVNVSVYIDKQWRQKGVARGLYESLFELLQLQEVYNAYAVIALPNSPSVMFHESFGFERIGIYHQVGYKDGEWHDVGHWEKILQPHENPPSSPVPLNKIQESDNYWSAIETGEPFLRL